MIELLVVVSMIGVLAAIGIQQLSIYRLRCFDAASESDLRNAATAEEAVYVTGGSYLTCDSAAACEAVLTGYRRSSGVSLAMTAAGSVFTGTSTHLNGSKLWAFDTMDGRLLFSISP